MSIGLIIWIAVVITAGGLNAWARSKNVGRRRNRGTSRPLPHEERKFDDLPDWDQRQMKQSD